jgi:hypothetical protein
MNSFYGTIVYPITYILSLFSINHIPSCLGFRVDMVSNLDLASMIFCSLSSITTLPHQQNAYVSVQLISIETMVVFTLGMP